MSGDVAQIFAGCDGEAAVRARFKKVAKAVHPDVSKNPLASEAFAILSRFVEKRAKRADALPEGPKSKTLVVERTPGVVETVSVLRSYDGDLGEEYVTPNGLVTKFRDRKTASKHVSRVGAVAAVMTGQLESYKIVVPERAQLFADGVTAYTSRRPNTASLRAVLDAWGPWDPRSATWLASCLMDFACLMDNQKMVHCGLTPENVFVDTDNHSLCVVGGWAYSARRGEKLQFLPKFVHAAASRYLGDKKAKAQVDLAAGKALVSLVLGSNFNVSPTPLKAWIAGSGVGADPVEEYAKWDRVRGDSFGARKFVKFGNTAADAYKEK